MNNLEFTKDLIKGRIAETIFEQMFRESGNFTILKSGYENTLPELAQYQHLMGDEGKKAVNNVRNAPDFVLISQDKKDVYLVEVKYRTHWLDKDIKEIAEHILERWSPSWLFLASPKGFFFEPCHTIVKNEGAIGGLYDKWVSKELQEEYLKILTSDIS